VEAAIDEDTLTHYRRVLGNDHPVLLRVANNHDAGLRARSDELRQRAEGRLRRLQDAGQSKARLYLADEDDGIHGAGAFFLLLDEPEVYGLPPDPVDTRHELGSIWAAAGAAALALGCGLTATVFGGRR